MASMPADDAPPVVQTRIRGLAGACRGQDDLVYSKETRHTITESVDVVLHDARGGALRDYNMSGGEGVHLNLSYPPPYGLP